MTAQIRTGEVGVDEGSYPLIAKERIMRRRHQLNEFWTRLRGLLRSRGTNNFRFENVSPKRP
jgi:hypothetical protein